tara:strand:+ start:637 stop:870 length:234 start_codon:yes stop_codon:yes gene_type:complete
MARVLPEKQTRGRRAAESAEKPSADMQREFETKRSLFNIRKKTQEYKEEKGGFVYEDEPRSKKAKELIRKGKIVGYT